METKTDDFGLISMINLREKCPFSACLTLQQQTIILSQLNAIAYLWRHFYAFFMVWLIDWLILIFWPWIIWIHKITKSGLESQDRKEQEEEEEKEKRDIEVKKWRKKDCTKYVKKFSVEVKSYVFQCLKNDLISMNW